MFLVLMSAGGELMLSAGHQYETAPRPAPECWFVYPIKDANHPDLQTRECFNYPRNTWRVSLEQGAAKIVKFARGGAEQPPLPPLLQVEPRIMRGHRTSVKFADSWLLGFDGGEFGGGLWVSNLDGSQTKEIWNQDIRSITPVGDKILALSGLAHMSLDSGDALVLSPPRGINAPVERVIPLDSAPLATTEERLHSDRHHMQPIAHHGRVGVAALGFASGLRALSVPELDDKRIGRHDIYWDANVGPQAFAAGIH